MTLLQDKYMVFVGIRMFSLQVTGILYFIIQTQR